MNFHKLGLFSSWSVGERFDGFCLKHYYYYFLVSIPGIPDYM